jgi:acyl-CoA thioesterase II
MLTVRTGWIPQMLHAYFLAPGQAGRPIRLSVESVRDGGRSSHQRVTLSQDGTRVAEVTVLCAAPSVTGPLTVRPVPVPGPSADPARKSIFETRWHFGGLGIRPPEQAPDSLPYHPVWVRAVQPAQTGWPLAAFVSDLGLVLAAIRPDERRTRTAVTTDHCIWFHHPPRADAWYLVDASLRHRSDDRAQVCADLFDDRGHIIASVAQGVTVISLNPARTRPSPA